MRDSETPSRVRTPLLVAVVCGLGIAIVLAGIGVVAIAEPPPSGPAPGPTTVQAMDREIAATTKRLEALLVLAGKDPRWRQIETYVAYSIEDFADRHREVKAEVLIEIVGDKDAPITLREKAKSLIVSQEARRHDPDLVLERGRYKPRAQWCKKYVTKLLVSDNEVTRRYAHEILVTLFRSHRMDNLVVQYDARNGTKAQWRKTQGHWNKVLAK